MPHCQLAELFFTALIGSLTLALLILTLREGSLQSRSH